MIESDYNRRVLAYYLCCPICNRTILCNSKAWCTHSLYLGSCITRSFIQNCSSCICRLWLSNKNDRRIIIPFYKLIVCIFCKRKCNFLSKRIILCPSKIYRTFCRNTGKSYSCFFISRLSNLIVP